MSEAATSDMHGGHARAWDHALRAAGYLRLCRGNAAGALISLVLGSALAVAGPWAVRLLVDRGITAGDARAVSLFAVIFLVAEIFRQGADFLQSFLLRRVGMRSTHALRCEVFNRLQRISPEYFDARPPGQVVTLVTTDVAAVGDALSTGVIGILRDAVVFVGTGTALLVLHAQFGVLTIGCSLAVGVPAAFFRRRAAGAARRSGEALAKVHETLEENLAGREVAQLFGIEGERGRLFRDRSEHLSEAFLSFIKTKSFLEGGATISSALAMTLLIGLGGAQISAGSLSLGLWLAAIQYVPYLLGGVGGITDKSVTILSGLKAGERVFELLDLPDHLPSPAASSSPRSGTPGLEVTSLRFWYSPGREVLRDISATVRQGEKVALVGRSGAGKTTFARLIARCYDPREGAVHWRGRDLRTIPLKELRRDVAFVTQDVAVFSGTILENISLGLERAGRSEILEAARAAGLEALAYRMTKGYDTVLSQGGPELSMGERQLLSLARVMVRRPNLLILDEPTASVDVESEARILEALRRLDESRTVITIAHRFTTVRDAERVLVMDSGKIVEDGSPAELMGRGGFLSRMVTLQCPLAGGTDRRSARVRED